MPRHPSLAILALVRNEASRWLPSILDAWSDFADAILVLDDNSTDDTPAVLQACPKVEYRKLLGCGDSMWGNESPAREQLFNIGRTSGYDWLMVLDADMVPACDPRPLLAATEADSIAFRLYDLWQTNPLAYRSDGMWQAHNTPRLWCIRNPGTATTYQWPERGIHCGHFPPDLTLHRTIVAPDEYSLLHFAYSDATERQRKSQQYLATSSKLSPQEYHHAESILRKPILSLLPFTPQYDIVKAS